MPGDGLEVAVVVEDGRILSEGGNRDQAIGDGSETLSGAAACPVDDCGINDYHGGFILSNTDFTFRDPRGGPPDCEDRLLLGGPPSDGVALYLMPTGVRTGIVLVPPRNTVFPMSLDRRSSPAWPGGPAESYEAITIDRQLVAYLRAFVGSDASTADHDALAGIVWSLRYRGGDVAMHFDAEGRVGINGLFATETCIACRVNWLLRSSEAAEACRDQVRL